MSDAYSTFGTLLKRGDGGTPEVFATIGGLKDVDEVGAELRTEESTSHDSGGWVEKTAHLLDAGEAAFVLNWDPADPTHIQLRSDRDSRVKRNFQLVEPFAGGETASFAALVTKIGKPYPVEGLMEANVTLDITGPISWA